MNELFFSDRNAIQKDADQWAAYNSMRNTVVTAGPGSGKTRVLTLKAMKLLSSDIHRPSGIACISYSRETVRELKKRLKGYGYQSNNHDFIGTIHGFCLLHVLIPFGHLFPQYRIPQPLKIAPSDLGMEIYRSVLHELGIDDERQLSKIELDKYRSLSLVGSSTIELTFSNLEGRASRLFDEKLNATGHIDFISITNIATRIIREQEYVRYTLESKFSWLLIDEYQDLGKALHEMVLELFGNTSIKIFAVGDMNQSIYGFTGAYPDFLNEINEKDDFISISLKSNYRSFQGIIEASLDTLDPSPPRPEYFTKKENDENAEFIFIRCERNMDQQYRCAADKVIPRLIEKGISYNEIGIITGTNGEVVAISQFLKDKDIPFYIAKWQFDKSSDISIWLQDCAQWCLDRTKQSFDDLFSFWKILLELHNDKKSYWEETQKKVFFHSVLIDSRQFEIIKNWIEFIIQGLDLFSTLDKSDRYPEEKDNLEKIISEATIGNLNNVPLRRFAYLGEPENEVTVTTRHSSKGLEFEAIILLGMEQGNFPWFSHQEGSREYEEDKRTCYVCVSRAKKICVLMYSKEITRQTQFGPRTFTYPPSIFWNILSQKFGSEENIFDAEHF